MLADAACTAHTQRKVHDIHVHHPASITTEELNHLGALYAIESESCGTPAAATGGQESQKRPVDAVAVYWILLQINTLSRHSDTAKTFVYLLKQWDPLDEYCCNGWVGIIDNKLPDRCHLVCMYRSDRTVVHNARHLDAPEEDVVFLTKADGPQRTFSGIVIRICKTVISVVAQRIPLVQNISERLAQPGFLRQSGAFLHQPVMQGYQQRFTSGPPGCQSLSCREAAYFLFRRVQFTDTFQGFLCRLCLSAYIDVVDYSARVGPACGFC
ncbi:hypothetical protein GM31_18265 [Trabulsiella odontotermitis]|uniref:Transposase IS66 central domain-containing protein n=1 Tax=Trabulsiella odontotermitis TaxID=379893 RepID=A0A0L0GYB5_9ENTR|nr:hypothetical protein GM31_18265 [Trabulsiella odontotermitis]